MTVNKGLLNVLLGQYVGSLSYFSRINISAESAKAKLSKRCKKVAGDVELFSKVLNYTPEYK